MTISPTRLLLLPLVLLGALIAPAAAGATEQTYTYSKQITVSGYEVRQGLSFGDVHHPAVDGHVTKMEVDIVDAPQNGDPVPISRLMLHHIVFLNVGRHDRTCARGFRDFGGRRATRASPRALLRRRRGAGQALLPGGYGYGSRPNDTWAMTYMVMNHRQRPTRPTSSTR